MSETPERHPGGRPTEYDPAHCEALKDFMGQGYSLTAFAGSIGVCRDTLNEWTRRHPEFSDAVKVGKAKRTMKLEETLLLGETGPKVTAHIFALKNADPEGWKDKQEHEHTGRDGGPIQNMDVSHLTPEQLRAIASAKLTADA